MPKKINTTKLFKRLILVTLLGMVVGLFVFNRFVKRYGYDGALDFITNYYHNKQLANEVEVLNMKISMSEKDYDFLSDKRDEALERGVQINVGDNYVDCDVEVDGEKSKGTIRLKGHMTDHLEGDKWSFRVKTDEPILGMYRFSLQHPGTRNYIYEWTYHQLLAHEGIIHLNYDFLNVELNDKDLGIYAMEEHFGQHVLEHNNRPKGAILRWNPNLYWEWRIDELHHIYLDEEYSAYSSSFAEPYDRGTVKDDEELLQNYQKGASQLEAFRRGDKITSEVFDVELMARFHAIIDLVGGYHSLDWSDVKFYYNNETELIEPVGYESFSVRKSERIAGQRLPDDYGKVDEDYHNQLFSDPVFFKAYIKALERICDEAYFNEFIASISTQFDQKMGILSKEFAYRKFPFDPYFENIDLIRHNLELPKPFHAFTQKWDDSTAYFELAPVTDFPIELVKIEIDGKEKVSLEGIILPAKARNTFATYFPLKVNHHSKKVKNCVITAKIPGSKNEFEIVVEEYSSYQTVMDLDEFLTPKTSIEEHPKIVFNAYDSIYFFDEMDISIQEEYELTNGKLRLLPGQKITFSNNGSFTFNNSKLESFGANENEVLLIGENKGETISAFNSELDFKNTNFVEMKNTLYIVNSTTSINHCSVADVQSNFIQSLNSEIVVVDSYFGNVKQFGLLDRSSLTMSNVQSKKGDTFLHSDGSIVKMNSCNIQEHKKVFELDHLAINKAWNIKLNENEQIGYLNNSSECHFYGGDLGNADVGFEVADAKNNYASILNIYKSKQDQVKKLKI
ncbi:CotH kinase family protein [Paracrocinitomix mangrovi]|uniref:CotH kinase family protein n=1 Tax=Paracrocinitomix mangrovi TaxID=2862509 RepID=UPI001C8DB63D|nr:CotH kinase family protein [Paracrocinitomix mangrovi]UKN02851.1 CotH kinase family protein [Paracrocinitomix mangrovi]